MYQGPFSFGERCLGSRSQTEAAQSMISESVLYGLYNTEPEKSLFDIGVNHSDTFEKDKAGTLRVIQKEIAAFTVLWVPYIHY